MNRCCLDSLILTNKFPKSILMVKKGQLRMLFVLMLSVALNLVLSGLYFKGDYFYDFWVSRSDSKDELSWSRKAAEEAEKVASIPCSGHGIAFWDGMHVADQYGVERQPMCECYACYSGHDCSNLTLPCVADAVKGEPLFLEPFWTKHQNKESSAVVISGWNRIAYLYPSPTGFMSEELEKHIRKLHESVGNAVTAGKYIVFGTGSTHLLHAAVHAISSTFPNSSSLPALVVASPPYYSTYKTQTDLFDSTKYKFKGNASKWVNRATGRKVFIEFVTSPNNPDGQLNKAVLQKGPSVKTIHDHAYYWPHFTADEDLMLFTMSKFTGHAGSRFGWAIVKDKEVYQKMMEYVGVSVLGISHDSQLRALKLMKAVIKDGGKQLFEFGHSTMSQRWQRINETVSQASSRFSLQSITPQYCTFYRKVRAPSPAYAWLKCVREEDKDCYQVLKAGGILGQKGSAYGVEDRYVRLSLLKSQDDFDVLMYNLATLISSSKTPIPRFSAS